MMAEYTPFIQDGERWLAPLGGLVAEVRGGDLRLYQQDGTAVGRFPLGPRLSGGPTTVEAWHQEQGVLTATLNERRDVQVRLWLQNGRLHYHTMLGLPGPVEITYFPGATFHGPQWQTFVPDAMNRAWEKATPQAVTVATHADLGTQVTGGGTPTWVQSPPPRACALQYAQGWLAVVVPRALPVAATTFAVDRTEHFSISFAEYCQGNADNRGPEVVFTGGLDAAFQALDELAAVGHEQREAGPAPAAPWWVQPLFCTWGEQVQWARNTGHAEEALTLENVRHWVQALSERLGTTAFNVALDDRWFDFAGDFGPSKAAFGQEQAMRGFIDELHAAGHRVLLWFSPFAIEGSAQVAQTVREGLVNDRQGNPISAPFSPLVRDMTHPAMREQLWVTIRHLLSPSGLDADGLKIATIFNTPDPRTTVAHDASWGCGDQLWAKTLELIAQAAREAKAEALVTVTSAMPYLQRDAGMVRLNTNPQRIPLARWERARILTRALPGTLIETDGWPLHRDEAAMHWVTAPVYGVPTLYLATMFDGAEPLTDEDYRLLAATWVVYSLAPVWTDQRVVVEPDSAVFERYYADGTLAAKCHGTAVLVTVAGREIRACAREAREIELPIPGEQRVERAELVSVTGGTQPLELGDLTRRPLLCPVPDAGTTGQYVRVIVAA